MQQYIVLLLSLYCLSAEKVLKTGEKSCSSSTSDSDDLDECCYTEFQTPSCGVIDRLSVHKTSGAVSTACTDCDCKIESIVFSVRDAGCDDFTHDQNTKFECEDTTPTTKGVPAPPASSVDVTISRAEINETGPFSFGDTFTVTGADGKNLKPHLDISLSGDLNQELALTINCGRRFDVGDNFAGLRVESFVCKSEGNVTEESEESEESEDSDGGECVDGSTYADDLPGVVFTLPSSVELDEGELWALVNSPDGGESWWVNEQAWDAPQTNGFEWVEIGEMSSLTIEFQTKSPDNVSWVSAIYYGDIDLTDRTDVEAGDCTLATPSPSTTPSVSPDPCCFTELQTPHCADIDNGIIFDDTTDTVTYLPATDCQCRPFSVVLRLRDAGCDDFTHNQNCKMTCNASESSGGTETTISVFKGSIEEEGPFAIGDTFTWVGAEQGSGKVHPFLKISLSGEINQELNIRTDCSQRLDFGDQFGALEIVSFESDTCSGSESEMSVSAASEPSEESEPTQEEPPPEKSDSESSENSDAEDLGIDGSVYAEDLPGVLFTLPADTDLNDGDLWILMDCGEGNTNAGESWWVNGDMFEATVAGEAGFEWVKAEGVSIDTLEVYLQARVGGCTVGAIYFGDINARDNDIQIGDCDFCDFPTICHSRFECSCSEGASCGVYYGYSATSDASVDAVGFRPLPLDQIPDEECEADFASFIQRSSASSFTGYEKLNTARAFTISDASCANWLVVLYSAADGPEADRLAGRACLKIEGIDGATVYFNDNGDTYDEVNKMYEHTWAADKNDGMIFGPLPHNLEGKLSFFARDCTSPITTEQGIAGVEVGDYNGEELVFVSVGTEVELGSKDCGGYADTAPFAGSYCVGSDSGCEGTFTAGDNVGVVIESSPGITIDSVSCGGNDAAVTQADSSPYAALIESFTNSLPLAPADLLTCSIAAVETSTGLAVPVLSKPGCVVAYTDLECAVEGGEFVFNSGFCSTLDDVGLNGGANRVTRTEDSWVRTRFPPATAYYVQAADIPDGVDPTAVYNFRPLTRDVSGSLVYYEVFVFIPPVQDGNTSRGVVDVIVGHIRANGMPTSTTVQLDQSTSEVEGEFKSVGVYAFANRGTVTIEATEEEGKQAVVARIELRTACSTTYVIGETTLGGVTPEDMTPAVVDDVVTVIEDIVGSGSVDVEAIEEIVAEQQETGSKQESSGVKMTFTYTSSEVTSDQAQAALESSEVAAAIRAALIEAEIPVTSVNVDSRAPPTESQGSDDENVGGMVGGIVAGVVGAAVVAGAFVITRKRRQETHELTSVASEATVEGVVTLPSLVPSGKQLDDDSDMLSPGATEAHNDQL